MLGTVQDNVSGIVQILAIADSSNVGGVIILVYMIGDKRLWLACFKTLTFKLSNVNVEFVSCYHVFMTLIYSSVFRITCSCFPFYCWTIRACVRSMPRHVVSNRAGFTQFCLILLVVCSAACRMAFNYVVLWSSFLFFPK